jgi:hypothetical protein
MTKYSFLKVYLDDDGVLSARGTDIPTLVWLYDLINKHVAVQKKIDRFQYSFELKIDIPSECKRLRTASNVITEITWWLYYHLCEKGWEPLGKGEFRRAEDVQEGWVVRE